jgi:hypothetical protein
MLEHPARKVAADGLEHAVRYAHLDQLGDLTWLPEACPERLTSSCERLSRSCRVRFEEISPAVRQDNGSVVRTERRRTQQTLLLEVPLGHASVVASIEEITFGDDAEGIDGGEHPALGAVDFVHAITLSYWPTLTAARQVEVLREHVTRVAVLIPIAITRAAAATAVAVPTIAPIAPAIRGSYRSHTSRSFPPSADQILGTALSGLPW